METLPTSPETGSVIPPNAIPFDYDVFVGILKKPEADDLVKEFKGFLSRFNSSNDSISVMRKTIATFLESIYLQSLGNPAFVTDQDALDTNHIKEGWEKLVMGKIHDRVFGAPGTDEQRSNIQLQRRIDTYRWIEERHLDLPFTFGLSLEVAQAEMLRMNGFKSPRDKLIIMQNVLQLIVDLIKKCATLTDTEEHVASNDTLLPTLILVIIRASPPNLISNIKYVMRFRNQAELDLGSTQFVLTNMMSAISFIYNLTPKSLTLNEEETRRLIPESLRRGEGLGTSLFARPAGPVSSTNTTNQGTNSIPLKPDVNKFASQVTDFFGNFFRDVKSSADEFASNFQNTLTVNTNTNSQGGHQRGSSHSRTDSAGSESRKFFPGNSSASGRSRPDESPSSPTPRKDRATVQAEQEEYELQLAMALSLSEAQNTSQSLNKKKSTGSLIDDAEGSHTELEWKNAMIIPEDVSPRTKQALMDIQAEDGLSLPAAESVNDDEDDTPLQKTPEQTKQDHENDSSLI